MMFKGAMFAKPPPPSSRPTTATTSILTDLSEYPELTLLEWAEWAATAMWWERLYAGHRPRELGRLAVPPADVNGGAFRLHEAENNETAGDRDAEAERYVDGTTTDWPSATTQVPAPHVPAPPPPTPEQTFRRQLARRAADAEARQRIQARAQHAADHRPGHWQRLLAGSSSRVAVCSRNRLSPLRAFLQRPAACCS